MRRQIALIALATVGLLGVSACGPSGRSSPVSHDETSSIPLGAPVVYPRRDYVEQGPGRSGGVLKISTAIDTGTLDFQTIAGTTPKWLGRLIYDNLVYLDDKGRITPWLATSWEISPDGKTYTFHLRHDVTFSDGTRLDAAAVKANLDRIRDPATKTAMTTAYIAPYAGGKVIDDYTFQARLSEPYTPFLNVLAQSWLGLMSPKALKDKPKQLGDAPVGSGPYVVESYRRQQGIRFVRRPDYNWSPPFINHHGPAYLDRIEVDFVPEAITRYASLASGQYDFTMDAPPQSAAAIRADRQLVLGNRINLGNPTRAITFNVSKPPFNDVDVRKAFALAIDRDGITQSVGFGEFRPTAAFLSASTPNYDPSFGAALRFDPARANRILDEAGWTGRDAQGFRTKNGQRLGATILIVDAQGVAPVVVALQSDVKKIGFDLRIEQVPQVQYIQRRNDNAYQAMGGGYWHTNTPDGLYIVYDGRQIIHGDFIGQNTSRLTDPELDDLLGRARRATDQAQLRDLYSKAQRRLTELVPAVPLYENHTLIAYRAGVKGVIFDTSHNVPFFPSIWLQRGPS